MVGSNDNLVKQVPALFVKFLVLSYLQLRSNYSKPISQFSKMLKKLFVFFFLFIPLILSAQDSLRVIQGQKSSKDTSRIVAVKGKFKPNPKRALIYSLVLPGSGQIYNRDWWKLPLVYGAIGGMGYLVQQNYHEYKRYKTARELLLEGKPHEFSSQNPSESSLRAARDYYRSNFEMSCLGLGVIYALQGIEAYVAAHLKNFDVSEDLGLTPFMGNSVVGPYIGLNISLPIQNIASQKPSVFY